VPRTFALPEASPSPVVSKPPAGEQVASFSTPVLTNDKDRTNNLVICCGAIAGEIIDAGAEFSFNEAVGRRTENKGYKDAHAFVDGEEVDVIGGGICQIASTLYNTALVADFEILERHQHADEVYYVELGRDATIWYGNLDLRFKNTLAYPVKIGTEVKNGAVTVTLFSA